jgi:hypothetical protein
MPLTKAFKETIMVDLQDREFRAAYLADAIETDRVGKHAARITPHPHNEKGALRPVE